PLMQSLGAAARPLSFIWMVVGATGSFGQMRGCVGTRTPLAYIRYGCYCGLGGHGQPRDAIDWCCHRHDCCYTHAEQAGCRPKIERYSWQCDNQNIVCGESPNKCEELLCKCDKEIAYCLAQTKYNLKYLFYPRFLCGKDSPKCD
uniref:Phospholipase A2 n=1 Tax=Ursus americanus TaxID=9643 RepID=A0A452QWG7_URSAM